MKRFPLAEFKEIYSKVPRVTIEVVLINEKGVALTLRDIDPYKGYWHTPGGTLLYKEKIENAVKRIAKEELGIGVEVEKFLCYWVIPEWKQDKGYSHSVGLAHKVKKVGGKLHGSDQGSKIKFFKKMPEKMIKEQKEVLGKLLSDRNTC